LTINAVNKYRISLIFTVLTAGCFRLHNLFRKGLIYWDEGIFISGARFVNWRTGFLISKALGNIDSVSEKLIADTYLGLPVFLQKPSHVLLLSIWNSVGLNEVNTALLFSVFCGLVSIVLTAEIARKWFGLTAASLAAVWLAVQPYHTHYSRLALHETSSMCLFLLMIYTWRAPARDTFKLRLFSIGFLGMAAMGASYRYLPYLMICIMAELYIGVRSKQPVSELIKRWGLLAGGAFCCFLVLDYAYYLMFSPHYLWSQPDSYLAVLKMKFSGGESSFDFDHPGYYFYMLSRFDGIASVTTLMSAWLAHLYRRKKQDVFLFILIICPFILFSLTTTRVPRTITGLLPFFAISTGALLAEVFQKISKAGYRWATWLTVVCVLGLIVSLASGNYPIWQLKSGYPDVIKWLEAQGAETHLSTMPPVYAAYQGRKSVEPVPFELSYIKDVARNKNIRFLTVDWQKFLRYSRGVLEIEKAVLPVHAVPHNPGLFFATLYENHLPADVPGLRKDPTIGFIKVYDLQEAIAEIEATALNKDLEENEE
jgi:hypothetical protein